MGSSELYRKIEEKIAVCEENCEKDRGDAFLSTIRNSELETLRTLCERLKGEKSKERLRTELSGWLLELEKAKKREEEYPSFDWYDEHYHYKVLEGQCAAYRDVLELLEAESGGKL